MNFEPEQRREQAGSIVPMINVVFLLLIFFLMTSQIAPPEPFSVSPPAARADEKAQGEMILFLNSEGTLAFSDATGEEDVIAALADEVEAYCSLMGCTDETPLPPALLRADQGVSAQRVAELLPKLAALGFKEMHLITAEQ